MYFSSKYLVVPAILHESHPLTHKVDAQKKKQQLQDIQIARQAFIKAKSSSKIRQTRIKNVRSYSDTVYCHGNLVYYKRLYIPKPNKPASVIGKKIGLESV